MANESYVFLGQVVQAGDDVSLHAGQETYRFVICERKKRETDMKKGKSVMKKVVSLTLSFVLVQP